MEAATLVPIALKRVLPSWVTVPPGVTVNRPLAVSRKVCSLTDQPVGKLLDVKELIQVLFTSVLPCEETATLKVPGPVESMLNDVLPRMFGNGFTGRPVAVIWFASNTPQTPAAQEVHEKLTAPEPDVATVVKAEGPGPGAAPMDTVAEFAAETQRNALAIPVRARSFAFMLISLHGALAAALGCI